MFQLSAITFDFLVMLQFLYSPECYAYADSLSSVTSVEFRQKQVYFIGG